MTTTSGPSAPETLYRFGGARIKVRPQWLLIVIVILATVLRLHGIGNDSLWGDEALSVYISKKPIPQIVPAVIDYEQIPPLHHIVLHFWMEIFGDSEASLRMPSALAGVGAVLVMYALVRRLFGRPEAIAAALILAVSPMQIEYAHETRTYALTFFLAVLATDLFVRLIQQPTPRVRIAYAISAALLLYGHIYGAFVLIAHQIAYLAYLRSVASQDRLPNLRLWIMVNLAAAALYAPWVPIVFKWFRMVNVNFWVKEVTVHDIGRAFWMYSGSTPLFLIGIALMVIGFRRVWMRRRQTLVLILSLMLLPVIVPVIMSIIGKPSFAPRYGMVACVGYYPLLAAGIAALRPKVSQIATMLLYALLGFAGIGGDTVKIPKSPWRPAMVWLNQHLKSGDKSAVHIRANFRLYDYYIRRPDIPRRAFDTNSMPIDPGSLKPNERVWFVLHGEWARPYLILSRGPWYIISHHWFGDVLVMELSGTIPPGADPWPAAMSTIPTTAPATPSKPSPTSATPPPTS